MRAVLLALLLTGCGAAVIDLPEPPATVEPPATKQVDPNFCQNACKQLGLGYTEGALCWCGDRYACGCAFEKPVCEQVGCASAHP